MIKIYYEDNHLLVVEKPVNVPVQEDESKDLDLLTMLKNYLKEKYQKPGNVYLGLVHRLDRPVSGIMVFAKTSKAASRLSEQVRLCQMKKVYLAVVNGYLPATGHFHDYLLKDSKTNCTRVDFHGKEAILDYRVLKTKDCYSFVEVFLKTGRSHQIRVQFASRNHALFGDQRYGKAKRGEQIALHSSQISFYHPVTKEFLTFQSEVPIRYPFVIFQEK